MKTDEAALLKVDQRVIFDDGRTAIITNQDKDKQRVVLKFDYDKSTGYLQWLDMSPVSLHEEGKSIPPWKPPQPPASFPRPITRI